MNKPSAKAAEPTPAPDGWARAHPPMRSAAFGVRGKEAYMGYALNSLGNLPIDDGVDVYIFVVNGGWEGGHGQKIRDNFDHIARDIGSRAVIVRGLHDEEWTDEIAAKYLGPEHDRLFKALPALLVTDAHPERLTDNSLRLIVPLEDVESRVGRWDNFFRLLVNFARGREQTLPQKFREPSEVLSGANEILELKPNIWGNWNKPECFGCPLWQKPQMK